jgi:hypothetical protein
MAAGRIVEDQRHQHLLVVERGSVVARAHRFAVAQVLAVVAGHRHHRVAREIQRGERLQQPSDLPVGLRDPSVVEGADVRELGFAEVRLALVGQA